MLREVNLRRDAEDGDDGMYMDLEASDETLKLDLGETVNAVASLVPSTIAAVMVTLVSCIFLVKCCTGVILFFLDVFLFL